MQKFKPINNDQLMLLPPSVEDFIPSGHLARVINDVVETIDVSAIEARYSYLGQKSYPPHLLLKVLFYGYSIGMRSGRKIAAACESDTAFMFLAAMYKPDFRTINDFRKDNIDFIQKAFIHIVQLCKGLGMCKAGTLIIDSTKLKANASAERSKTKQQYQQWVERIDTDIKNILDEAAQTDAEEDKQYGEKRGDELPEALRSKQKLKEKIQEVLEQMNEEKERVNLTDKEAKFIKNNGKIDVNYSCQTAISEDGIIVSAYTNNCSSDRTDTIKTVNNAEINTGEDYKEILADSGYASFDNFEELDKRNKIIYIPDQQMNTEADKEQNPYHRNHFIYNEQKDCFVCPENKELPFYSNIIHRRNKQQSKVYKCKDCPLCDKQKLCVKGQYREIHIEKREHLRQQIRERLNNAEGKLKYLKRMRIESVFGNIKHNLNYIHLYLKGIKKTTAEWQLICIGHNLKKIHKLKMT
jgi:transposase